MWGTLLILVNSTVDAEPKPRGILLAAVTALVSRFMEYVDYCKVTAGPFVINQIVLTSVRCCTIVTRSFLCICKSARREYIRFGEAQKNNRIGSERVIGFDPVTVRIEILDRVEPPPALSGHRKYYLRSCSCLWCSLTFGAGVGCPETTRH